MIFGFILIVSLLSIALRQNITKSKNPLMPGFTLENNELLSSITHSSEYTILLLVDDKQNQFLRVLSNKTGKILSNTLISDLIGQDSKNKLE